MTDVKIYRFIDRYDQEEYVTLRDNDRLRFDEQAEVTLDDVTLTELADAIDCSMQSSERYDLMGIGEYMAGKFTEFVGEEKAKEILWQICKEKGFDWKF